MTPAFKSRIIYFEVNPTWTMPPTILTENVLPAVRRNRRYLQDKNMRVIDHQGHAVDPAGINGPATGVQTFPATPASFPRRPRRSGSNRDGRNCRCEERMRAWSFPEVSLNYRSAGRHARGVELAASCARPIPDRQALPDGRDTQKVRSQVHVWKALQPPDAAVHVASTAASTQFSISDV